jgi:outer membrane assembly lipoprotein YfiO
VRAWSAALALTLALGCAAEERPAGRAPAGGEERAAPGDVAEVGSAAPDGAPSGWLSAARADYDAGRYAEAAERLRRGTRLGTRGLQNEEGLFLLGESLFRAGEYEEAYFAYRRFLEQYGDSPRHEEVTGRCFEIGRRYAQGEALTTTLGIEGTDYHFGRDVLRAFQHENDRHSLADDAMHLCAESYFSEGEYEQAITNWLRLLQEYPESEWAQFAEYRLALAHYARSDGVQYDKAPIAAARQSLIGYARRHPQGDHIAAGEEQLRAIEEELASHELGIARHYRRWGHALSAKIYYEAILREYPRTAAAGEAKSELVLVAQAQPPAPPGPDDD